MASDYSKVAMLKFLMEHMPGYKTNYERCLMNAASNGSMEMMAFIESRGFSFAGHARKAITMASRNGHIKMVRDLIPIRGNETADDSIALKEAHKSGWDEGALFLLAYDGGAYFKTFTSILPSIMESFEIDGLFLEAVTSLANDLSISHPSLLVKEVEVYESLRYMRMTLS